MTDTIANSLAPAAPHPALNSLATALADKLRVNQQQGAAKLAEAQANLKSLHKTLATRRLEYVQAVLKALALFAGQPGAVVARANDLADELAGAVTDFKNASAGDASGAGSQTDSFFVNARGVLAQLQTVVARQAGAARAQGHRGTLADFVAAAKNAAGALDQATSGVNTLT